MTVITTAEWRVTLYDPIWHVSSRSAKANCCKLLYFVYLRYFTLWYKIHVTLGPVSRFCGLFVGAVWITTCYEVSYNSSPLV